MDFCHITRRVDNYHLPRIGWMSWTGWNRMDTRNWNTYLTSNMPDERSTGFFTAVNQVQGNEYCCFQKDLGNAAQTKYKTLKRDPAKFLFSFLEMRTKSITCWDLVLLWSLPVSSQAAHNSKSFPCWISMLHEDQLPPKPDWRTNSSWGTCELALR